MNHFMQHNGRGGIVRSLGLYQTINVQINISIYIGFS